MAMDKSYKLLKEEFVSNLSGGTIRDLAVVTAAVPVCPFSPCVQSKSDFRYS
jgi:hypothetical protein